MPLPQLILLVLFVALFVAAIMLAPKPEFEDARAKGLGDLQVPTASEARAVPILWGTAELRGPNVLWYGDLLVEEIEEEVKTGWFSSDTVVIGHRYFIGVHLLLCYGPLDRFTWFESNDMELWSGSISPSPTSGTVISISEPYFFGQEGEGGGIVGDLRVYGGGPNQNPNSYLEDVVDPIMPAYVDIAHVVWEQGEIGETERLGRWAFRCSRFPNNLSLDGSNHIVRGDADSGDANPAEVLYEILTDTTWGLEISASKIDIVSFRAAGNTLADEGLGFGMLLDRLSNAGDIIKEVLRQVDAVLFEDTDGVFYFNLIRDDYVLSGLPIFAEGNIVEMKSFSRGSWTQTFNHVNVAYIDRKKDFIKTGAFSQDLGNVKTQNKHVRADFEYPGVKVARTANIVARRELRQLSFPFAKVVLIVNREGQKIRPGDVIRFYWNNLGISEMVLRVMTVDQGELLEGKVELSCIQDMFQLAETIYDDPGDSGWNPVENLATAFVDELVRQAPRIGLNQTPSQFPNPETVARILSVAKKESGQVVRFIQRVDSGAGYEGKDGISTGTTPFGKLVNAYPKNTVDLEVSDLLLFDDEVNTHNLTNNVAENILQGQNLAMFEGAASDGSEDEIIGWEQLIDEGDGTWTLRNVHRGLCDTQARDHAAGTNLWFVSNGRAISRVVYPDTSTIDVKHQSRTTTDALDLSSATALPLTFNQRTKRPHHPANFTVNATRLPVATDETADLDFDWEHRLNTDALMYDADDASTGSQDTNVVYDMEFRHAVTQAVLRNETQVSPAPAWLTYLYTAAALQTDTGEVGDFPLEVSMQARDTSSTLTSLQDLVFDFNADIGGATVQSIDLDGATEYLANNTNFITNVTDEWSISVWTRGTSAAGGTPRSIFLAKNSGNNNNRIELLLTDDSAASPYQIKLWDSTGTLFKDYSFGSYAQNTWAMITATWDGSSLTVYQDGSAQTPTLTTDIGGTMNDVGGRQITVGVDAAKTAQWWVGQLFSPKVWSVELGATEVSDIATGLSGFNARVNSGNYISRDDLVHLWDFRTSAAIGQDYGHLTSNLIDILVNALNIAAGDLNPAQVP